MNVLVSFAALICGVAIYRLGVRDGEAGRVVPLIKRKHTAAPGRQLLSEIERYDGNVKEKR